MDRFRKKDINGILRTASDLGHYVGDAHVPLHTTSNYNGQLSNQLGLHAFWESRIPELFADKQYDYFVGKAEYIKDVPSFIWQTALESHTLVDSVLAIEKDFRNLSLLIANIVLMKEWGLRFALSAKNMRKLISRRCREWLKNACDKRFWP